MTTREFCMKLERYHGREYNAEQLDAMARYLGRFPEEKLERIYRRVLEICKVLPKIAHIREASHDLLIQPRKVAKLMSGCEKCGFTTWIVNKLADPQTQTEREVITRCECQRRPADRRRKTSQDFKPFEHQPETKPDAN